tara:strand:+ start:462 stop:902 length:441 start_codon:yes stop_codon:yes gene_type:complete
MVTFYSEALTQLVEFDKISDLSKQELRFFHGELLQVVHSLEESIKSARVKESRSSLPTDSNWLHRISTKRRIASKFATEVLSQLQGGSAAVQRVEYDRLYKAELDALLAFEFGDELPALQKELREKAQSAYRQWIADTEQIMWFVP